MHGQKMVHVSMRRANPAALLYVGCLINDMAIFIQYIDRGGIYVYKLGD